MSDQLTTEFKYELGAEVKDIFTGFSGTITARCEYVTGCKQYIVQPPVNDKGEFQDSIWLDENRVVLKGKSKKKVELPEVRTGGPQRQPRSTSPRR